jgi:hypothetical protein
MRFLGVAAAIVLSAGTASADICRFEGVRVLISDSGNSSTLEVSVRVRGDGCAVDFSQVALSAPDGAAPTIAVEQVFVGHKLTSVQVADGANAVHVREWRGEAGTVAVRWLVEGTTGGLHVELPRGMFPKASDPGARVERRVKSARSGVAKFGALGNIQVPPSAPGAAGGIGPTGPADQERIVSEFVPLGELVEPIPPSIATLDAFRDLVPKRVLDLTPENEEGWNDVAKRAYAASLHGDPVVASLGVHTLAWLGSGLSLQAVKIGKTASGDTAALPASVVDAIGDVEARLAKRFNATGRLLPLGRPAIFRKALADKPWDDASRANAAKAAVARLASVQVQDLTAFLVPAIVDGTAAPVDPPQPATVAPVQVPSTNATSPPTVEARHSRSRHKRHPGLYFGLIAAAVAIAWVLRSSER